MHGKRFYKETHTHGTSLAVQWLRLRASTVQTWVQSLVGELGSHRPRSVAKNIYIYTRNTHTNMHTTDQRKHLQSIQ